MILTYCYRVAQLLVVFVVFRQLEGRVLLLENFSQVPTNGTARCKTLVLQSDANHHSRYESYTAETFASVPQVEELYIVNKINNLDNFAFRQLPELRRMTLTENNLPILKPLDFSGLNLYALSLTDNNVNTVAPKTFAMSAIERIDLSQNCLTSVPVDAFDGTTLTHLLLADNQINTIAEHAFSTSLQWLDLSRNRLREVPITVFENLSVLRHLNVSRNRFPTLASALWLRNLEVLDASHNSIRLLLNGAFEDYPKLRELRLDNNELLYLNPLSFAKPSPIQKLYLHRNMMSFMPPESGSIFVNMRLMTYGGNPWSCACLLPIENYIKANQIHMDACDKSYFTDGKQPVCLSAYGTCYNNETLLLMEHPAVSQSLQAGYHC